MGKSFSIRIVPALVIVQIIGVILGLYGLASGPMLHAGNVFNKLVTWDSGWYLNIAEIGYHWNPATTVSQNIAFFPFCPLLDRLCILLFGSFFKAAIVLVSWVTGLASIFLFEKLARKTIGDEAGTATALYAFWPASSFYLMGYPTGPTNICAILALSSYFDGSAWLAAACIGLGTGFAPTIVFVGLPVGLHFLTVQLRTLPFLIAIRNAAGWMILSLWGMLAFMLYQQWAFHDPLAFIKVQAAWGYTPPPSEKLSRLFSLSWDIFNLRSGLSTVLAGIREYASGNLAGGRTTIQDGIQHLVDFAFFVFCLIGLAAGSVLIKRHRLLLISSGCAVVAGYVWFVMLTNANMLSTPRLIFPAVAMFLGLGILLDKTAGFIRLGVIGFSAVVSLLEMAFVVAGYWVV